VRRASSQGEHRTPSSREEREMTERQKKHKIALSLAYIKKKQ